MANWVKQFNLDGIDVDYEVIEATFASGDNLTGIQRILMLSMLEMAKPR
jgi:GH18 family chitinase